MHHEAHLAVAIQLRTAAEVVGIAVDIAHPAVAVDIGEAVAETAAMVAVGIGEAVAAIGAVEVVEATAVAVANSGNVLDVVSEGTARNET
jgi:hypothetical protein